MDQPPRVHGRQRTRQGTATVTTSPALTGGWRAAGEAAAAGVVEHQHEPSAVPTTRAQPDDVRMLDVGQRRRLAPQPVASGSRAAPAAA